MREEKLYVKILKYGEYTFIGPCPDEQTASRLAQNIQAQYSYFDHYKNHYEYTALADKCGEPQPWDPNPIPYELRYRINKTLD